MASHNIRAVLWYFKGGEAWSQESTAEWIQYRDIEMQIIEEAYQKGKSEVLLDKYRLDLREFIQFSRADPSKQRPIKREAGEELKACLREQRFAAPAPLASVPSYGNLREWCPFLNEWLKLPAGKRALLDFTSAIDACIRGIQTEATKHNSDSETEAKWMIERLIECKTKPRREVSKLCINFYTRECFLYHVLNTALRNADYSKLDTLGPLCFLILDHSRTCKGFTGTVYRGTHLTFPMIMSYKEAIGTWRSWPAYTSTSKNRAMAELLGNVLFIIEIVNVKFSPPRAYDISEVSQFPIEEEVLLPAGVSFQILSVEQNEQQKYVIKLKI